VVGTVRWGALRHLIDRKAGNRIRSGISSSG
jgi:hypothetical protein